MVIRLLAHLSDLVHQWPASVGWLTAWLVFIVISLVVRLT